MFENLRCACFKTAGAGYVFWRPASKIKAANERAEEVLEMIGLQALRDVPAGALPYASQRALEIGMTIACGAEVVILDEPTAGMSNTETAQAISLIRQVAQGRTLMIVEHDMGVVFELADRLRCWCTARSSPPAHRKKSATTRVKEAYPARRPHDARSPGSERVLRQSHILRRQFSLEEGEVVSLLGRNGVGLHHREIDHGGSAAARFHPLPRQ